MKRAVAGIGWVMAVALWAAAAWAEGAEALSFEKIVDHLDRAKNTNFAVEQYWKDHRNAEVTLRGKVVDVEGGRRKARLLLYNDARPAYNGFNIVGTFQVDLDKAAALKKGEEVSIKGFLVDYRIGKTKGTALYLANCTLP